MPGKLISWPDWPEFSEKNAELSDDLTEYKKVIVGRYGEASLTQSWLKTCNELAKVTEDITSLGTDYIPTVAYQDISSLSPEEKQRLKDVGCFKVEEVIPRKQADQLFRDLKTYVLENKSSITGWPKETPFIHNLYFSPSQITARSHPNILELSKELNNWWLEGQEDASVSQPLSYADGVRIRPPGVPFFGLGPHIDAGSLARWTDPVYQSVYSAVFSGRPEDLDCYDLSLRKDANQAMFQGNAHSTVFRSFQGWTALSPAAPGEGSLMLYPNVKWSISYLLLRPFFKAPADSADVLDASKWKFDPTTPWFPGTWKSDSQLLSPSSHPHLRLKECMVSIPAMEPGDTIWWHADVCHAVEVEHNGKHEACVAYIAATPSTEQNKKYMKQQVENFLAGKAPPDFEREGLSSERDFEGFTGEQSMLSGDEGRRAFGFGLLQQDTAVAA